MICGDRRLCNRDIVTSTAADTPFSDRSTTFRLNDLEQSGSRFEHHEFSTA